MILQKNKVFKQSFVPFDLKQARGAGQIQNGQGYAETYLQYTIFGMFVETLHSFLWINLSS